MIKKSKALLMTVLIACIMALLATSVFAEEGRVNWEQNAVVVKGMGVAPVNATSAAQARMLARRAAVVDGYRQLAEAVKGVNVDSQTTVQNMMITSDVVNTRVAAFIQGARIISEQVLPDGGYEVTMSVSMFGVSNSLAEIVMPHSEKMEAFPAPVPSVTPSQPTSVNVNIEIGANNNNSVTNPTQKPVKKTTSSAAPAPAGTAIGGYTGVIVDCRGLGLQPVMSPVIKNENGTPIYGYKNLDYKKVISNGMAGYTTDINNAQRAGTNPLVVKATRIDGFGNPVLSVADANRVLIENGASGFLDRTNVVFVR